MIAKLQILAEQHPTRGFGVYYGRIRNEGTALESQTGKTRVWPAKNKLRILQKE